MWLVGLKHFIDKLCHFYVILWHLLYTNLFADIKQLCRFNFSTKPYNIVCKDSPPGPRIYWIPSYLLNLYLANSFSFVFQQPAKSVYFSFFSTRTSSMYKFGTSSMYNVFCGLNNFCLIICRNIMLSDIFYFILIAFL